MTTKLHINISQGVIDIEGDPDFVRDIYADFKDQLLSSSKPHNHAIAEPNESVASEKSGNSRGKGKRKVFPRKKGSGDDAGSDVNAGAPTLDKDLDTSGLAAFFGQFEPKNHPEKILVFLTFLIDELGIKSPNTDQVFTCYTRANERVPKAFAQAFRDASGKNFGYIDYKSPTNMRVTTAGANHFKFDLKRKPAE